MAKKKDKSPSSGTPSEGQEVTTPGKPQQPITSTKLISSTAVKWPDPCSECGCPGFIHNDRRSGVEGGPCRNPVCIRLGRCSAGYNKKAEPATP